MIYRELKLDKRKIVIDGEIARVSKYGDDKPTFALWFEPTAGTMSVTEKEFN